MGFHPKSAIIFLLFFTFFCIFSGSATLLVDPQFLLVEEDWPIGTNLPVTVCPKNSKILSGDDSHYFHVAKLNDSCATLKLNRELDADKENADGLRGQSFSLVIGGPKKSRATLEIQIVDVNDNPPQFYNTPSTIEISESAEIGSEIFKILTRDPDTGISGISRFSVEGDNSFKVDKRKCGNGKCSTILRLAKKLDFERKPVHFFNITAKDGDPHSNRTHSVDFAVSVHVKNEQNKPPVFITDFSKEMNIFGKSEGDLIMKIMAKDTDFDSKMLYTIAENEYIEIEESSGELRIKKMLQDGQNLEIEITATEKNTQGLSVTGRMEIISKSGKKSEKNVFCEFPIYEGTIMKERGIFENPVIIKTLIPVKNEMVQLIGGSDAFQLDAISENQLELKIANWTGIESSQLMVKSISGGECRILIRYLGSNRNQTYEFTLLENKNRSIIGEIGGNMVYTIRGDGAEKFAISTNGTLENLVPLDREDREMYDLQLIGESDTKMVRIKIGDENDNPPVFENTHLLVTIDEGKSEKVQVMATDRDIGDNGLVHYSLVSNHTLPIDISDGVLFIGAIDRDTLNSSDVNLTVLATDNGTPPMRAKLLVTIRVKDINDNAPIFSNSKYSIILDANISPGGILGKVSARDSDATSPNNYIRYNSENERFKVSDNGEIVYMGPGTLSKNTHQSFNISATDGGDPPNMATSLVVINEHKNVLQNELTTQINSNDTSEKSEIKWLNAGMSGYSYELVRATSAGFQDSEVMKWIEIDQKSGRIVTVGRIDPDRVKQIKLYISMRKGKREVPVELIINVVDTDEVAPTFTKSAATRFLTTTESIAVGSVVSAIPAEGVTSEDRIRYSLRIVTGPDGKLAIDGNGVIRVVSQLDFEKSPNIKGFVVAEAENGNHAKVPFELIILDTNDNRPIFKNNSVFVTSLNEDSILGTILDLPYPLAVDKDSGKFAELQYSITGDEGFFKIDRGNSTIRLISPLDFETQRTHSLTIKCVDNAGHPPHHEVFATLTIHVLDTNDNDPQIHNTDLTHLTIGEDAPPGTTITTLLISDADDAGKQRVDVSVNSTMLRVDDTNRLVTATPLHGHAGQRLCATIHAKDAGGRAVSAACCVTVYPATNTHHHPLVVSPKHNSIHYFDENIAYEELLRVRVLEEESNGVRFRLDERFKKDWQYFTIGAENGSLVARHPFDFEKKTVYEIKTLACRVDNCTSTHLFISVNDRNDNCPMFPKQDVRLNVLENEKGLRQVGRIPAALDSDFHSDNTKVCYTTDTPIFFFSDHTLPILYTNSSFDREQRKQHQITITAYDCHLSCRDPHKPINGTIVALIDVVDVNDNFPRFSEKMYHTTVVQGQINAGSHILTISATDADDEPSGLKYSLRGLTRTPSHTFTPPSSPLTIDETSGELTATTLLTHPSYTLTAVVADGAGHEDTATIMVSVVTYAQQTELLFDAPFDLVVRDEKKIVAKLSNATGFQTIVDKCRQNSNFTLMLVHFVDHDGQFVNVDRAINLLMSSSSTSRSELRSVYGLRDAFPSVTIPSRIPQFISIGVLVFFVVFVVSLCIWCRQRNSYERKLRNISAHASVVHTLGSRGQKSNPTYGDVQISRHPPAPPPPPNVAINLQSTEL